MEEPIAHSTYPRTAVVFSVETEVDHQPQRAFYTATVCQDADRWKWASAEPATERWGALQ